MTVVDWRTLPAADVARCYDHERAFWTGRFDWDTTDNWRRVEAARAAGTLPGFLVMDGSTPAGWGFHLLHRGTLQIGGVTAGSADAVDALIEQMLTSPEAGRARDAMAFVPETAAPVGDALLARGFGVRRFAYLMRPLDADNPDATDCRSFHAGRLTAFADLLARAYPGADPARPFAPRGTADEWLDYTGQLAAQTGCGELLPWASVDDEQAGVPGRLLGGVLTTRIAPRTAHLAQVAVDPDCRGQGRGRRLLRAALARLQGRGYSHVSLLVAEDNAAAMRLYLESGFRRRGAFVSAWRPMAASTEAADA